MKRILFITNMMPFPGNSGGTIKTRKLIDGLLEKGYEIRLCFLDVNPEDNSEQWQEKYHNKALIITRFYNGNNVRSLRNFLKSLVKGVPLNVYRNSSKEMEKYIKKVLINNKIDVIIADHIEVVQFVPREYTDIAIFHDHNAEYIIWERYAKQQKNFLKKLMVYFEAERIKAYEKKACRIFRKVMAAPKDLKFISGGNVNEKFGITYHMGDDNLLDLPDIVKPIEFNILFIGTLTWEANVQGILWFIQKVLPIIKSRYPEVKVNIIGKADSDLIASVDENNVCFLGFVDDLEYYMKTAEVFICPLFFGSGMKLKIIEAMYRGIPFVTTPVGAESIIVEDKEGTYTYPYAGLIADSPKCFADAVIKIHNNKNMWESMSKTARLIARKEYRWSDEINRFSEAIENI